MCTMIFLLNHPLAKIRLPDIQQRTMRSSFFRTRGKTTVMPDFVSLDLWSMITLLGLWSKFLSACHHCKKALKSSWLILAHHCFYAVNFFTCLVSLLRGGDDLKDICAGIFDNQRQQVKRWGTCVPTRQIQAVTQESRDAIPCSSARNSIEQNLHCSGNLTGPDLGCSDEHIAQMIRWHKLARFTGLINLLLMVIEIFLLQI